MRTGGAPRRQLVIGDRVRVDGVPHVVIGVSGTGVRLADEWKAPPFPDCGNCVF